MTYLILHLIAHLVLFFASGWLIFCHMIISCILFRIKLQVAIANLLFSLVVLSGDSNLWDEPMKIILMADFNFSFSQTSTRVSITVWKYGKCLFFILSKVFDIALIYIFKIPPQFPTWSPSKPQSYVHSEKDLFLPMFQNIRLSPKSAVISKSTRPSLSKSWKIYIFI